MLEAFSHQLNADATAPSVIRRLLRQWLDNAQWPTYEAEDLVYVVSEAVSNSVEHGYRDLDHDALVEVTAEEELVSVRQRRIVITVADHGRWRPLRTEQSNRRRGMPLMRALTDSLEINRAATGTLVTLTSRPVHTIRRRAKGNTELGL